MGFHALLLALGSAITTAAGSVAHQLRTLTVATQSWSCMDCGVSNELDRDTCWSCGAGYGQDPLYPSHIPMDRRWICMSCAVWNGIARTTCWRCGDPRSDPENPQAITAGRQVLPGTPDPAIRGPPTRRVPSRTAGEVASRRRNS